MKIKIMLNVDFLVDVPPRKEYHFGTEAAKARKNVLRYVYGVMGLKNGRRKGVSVRYVGSEEIITSGLRGMIGGGRG
jgi:hypothetical protein